jgi:ABC-2 type transport system ATP-binding protein
MGYLPENNPLYSEMYVHEYLRFVGRLYGINGMALRNRISEMVDLFGLTEEQNKKIEMLSKGYKQRVGLAQSLIHDPSVLILDEPTSGLDPNQLIEIRNLIKEISKNKTVLFSTHIMQEVSALCDRAIIINKGRIVADDMLSNLMSRQASAKSLIIEFETETSTAQLTEITGVVNVQLIGANKFKVIADSKVDLRSEIFRYAAANGLTLIGLQQEEETLEGLFRELTIDKAE